MGQFQPIDPPRLHSQHECDFRGRYVNDKQCEIMALLTELKRPHSPCSRQRSRQTSCRRRRSYETILSAYSRQLRVFLNVGEEVQMEERCDSEEVSCQTRIRHAALV